MVAKKVQSTGYISALSQENKNSAFKEQSSVISISDIECVFITNFLPLFPQAIFFLSQLDFGTF